MKKILKLLAMLVLILPFSAILSACGGGDGGSSSFDFSQEMVADSPVGDVHLTSRNGTVAKGDDLEVQLYISEGVNSDGIVIKVNGKTVDNTNFLYRYDSDPETAITGTVDKTKSRYLYYTVENVQNDIEITVDASACKYIDVVISYNNIPKTSNSEVPYFYIAKKEIAGIQEDTASFIADESLLQNSTYFEKKTGGSNQVSVKFNSEVYMSFPTTELESIIYKSVEANTSRPLHSLKKLETSGCAVTYYGDGSNDKLFNLNKVTSNVELDLMDEGNTYSDIPNTIAITMAEGNSNIEASYLFEQEIAGSDFNDVDDVKLNEGTANEKTYKSQDSQAYLYLGEGEFVPNDFSTGKNVSSNQVMFRVKGWNDLADQRFPNFVDNLKIYLSTDQYKLENRIVIPEENIQRYDTDLLVTVDLDMLKINDAYRTEYIHSFETATQGGSSENYIRGIAFLTFEVEQECIHDNFIGIKASYAQDTISNIAMAYVESSKAIPLNNSLEIAFSQYKNGELYNYYRNAARYAAVDTEIANVKKYEQASIINSEYFCNIYSYNEQLYGNKISSSSPFNPTSVDDFTDANRLLRVDKSGAPFSLYIGSEKIADLTQVQGSIYKSSGEVYVDIGNSEETSIYVDNLYMDASCSDASKILVFNTEGSQDYMISFFGKMSVYANNGYGASGELESSRLYDYSKAKIAYSIDSGESQKVSNVEKVSEGNCLSIYEPLNDQHSLIPGRLMSIVFDVAGVKEAGYDTPHTFNFTSYYKDGAEVIADRASDEFYILTDASVGSDISKMKLGDTDKWMQITNNTTSANLDIKYGVPDVSRVIYFYSTRSIGDLTGGNTIKRGIDGTGTSQISICSVNALYEEGSVIQVEKDGKTFYLGAMLLTGVFEDSQTFNFYTIAD